MQPLSPLTKAGLTLGVGLGGFVDGIVLHQILGWHHLICETATCQPTSVEDLQQQNVQDGYFHALVWVVTLVGVVLLFRARRQWQPWDGRALGASMLAGWGLFNFVEGLINHQILGLHHVRPGHPDQLLWDLGFLATGPLFVGIGWWLTASQRESSAAGGPLIER